MKIVQINATCGVGSTGKICVGISNLMSESGIEGRIIYSARSNGDPKGIGMSSNNYIKLQALKSRVLGNYGFNSKTATRNIIAELERMNPDIVHLHNIHGHDCHLEMLFNYFKKKNQKLVWTFHDCWAFTGYCPHFHMVKCYKWKSECSECVQRKEYSWFFDRSREIFNKKKELFSGLDLTIITPSEWLAGLVRESFLGNYPVKVINNGIDLDVFKPTESDFREKHGLQNKKIVLGVAFGWGVRKGLDVFEELARRLPEDEYSIVLVGTSDEIDARLPKNIISIHRTQNQKELAEIYTAADVFVNPTREDNYPTVNMEAIACGTPVITFKTGGSPEMLDENCGSVVECEDVDALEREIVRICANAGAFSEKCAERSRSFAQNERFRDYLKLYQEIDD